MKRVRRRVEGSALVKRMLTAAYTAMAAATRNHASEFLPDGLFARDKITSQMRERLSGCPMTSTGAERLFAIGRKHDERAGCSRDDTRAGAILGDVDNTHVWMRERPDGEREWAELRKRARAEMCETMQQKRLKVGAAERRVRDEKLATLRAKKAAKADELARLDALPLATRYSELVQMSVDSLRDQLKKHKRLGQKGFTVSQPNRTAYVLQLQTLLLAADSYANDLAEGDSGISGRFVKRKAASAGGGKAKKKKASPGVTEYMGYTWTAEEEDDFEVEAIVGKVIADGATVYANQGKAKKGTELYRIVWKDYPPDLVWYEPKANISGDLIDVYEAQLDQEAKEEEEEAQAQRELDELEAEEEMPPP